MELLVLKATIKWLLNIHYHLFHIKIFKKVSKHFKNIRQITYLVSKISKTDFFRISEKTDDRSRKIQILESFFTIIFELMIGIFPENSSQIGQKSDLRTGFFRFQEN